MGADEVAQLLLGDLLRALVRVEPEQPHEQVRRARQQPHHGAADPRHDLEHRRHRERDALRALQRDALGHELAQHERQVRHERRDRDERHRARHARVQPPRLRASRPAAPTAWPRRRPTRRTRRTSPRPAPRPGTGWGRPAAAAPARPRRPGSRSTWLSRSVSTASSEPEKNPPIVTNTTMRARLVKSAGHAGQHSPLRATPPSDLPGTDRRFAIGWAATTAPRSCGPRVVPAREREPACQRPSRSGRARGRRRSRRPRSARRRRWPSAAPSRRPRSRVRDDRRRRGAARAPHRAARRRRGRGRRRPCSCCSCRRRASCPGASCSRAACCSGGARSSGGGRLPVGEPGRVTLGLAVLAGALAAWVGAAEHPGARARRLRPRLRPADLALALPVGIGIACTGAVARGEDPDPDPGHAHGRLGQRRPLQHGPHDPAVRRRRLRAAPADARRHLAVRQLPAGLPRRRRRGRRAADRPRRHVARPGARRVHAGDGAGGHRGRHHGGGRVLRAARRPAPTGARRAGRGVRLGRVPPRAGRAGHRRRHRELRRRLRPGRRRRAAGGARGPGGRRRSRSPRSAVRSSASRRPGCCCSPWPGPRSSCWSCRCGGAGGRRPGCTSRCRRASSSAVVVGLAHTAVVLSRVQAANPLTIDGGRVHVDFGLLVAAGLAIVGMGVALVRRHPRVAGLMAMPIVATATAAWLIALQVAANGEITYYGLKFLLGAEIVLFAVLAVPVVHLLDRRAPLGRDRVRGVLASGIVALALTQVFGLTATGLGPSASAPRRPGSRTRSSRSSRSPQPPAAADLAYRIADLDAPLPAFWIDIAGDRRVSPILAGQWFLAFTDTWTLEANAVASITALRGPDEVPAVAERILLRRPDAVVVVRREDAAAVRRAVGPDPGAADRTGCDAGATAGAGRRVLAAAARPPWWRCRSVWWAPRSAWPTTATATRLYCGAGLVPAHARRPLELAGRRRPRLRHGRPGLPGPHRVRRAAGAAARDGRLRPDVVADPARRAVRAGRRRAHRPGGVGGGAGSAAARARARAGAAGRPDVHPVLPLDVQRARGPARRVRPVPRGGGRGGHRPGGGAGAGRRAGARGGGRAARGHGQGVVRPAARGGARRRGGHAVGRRRLGGPRAWPAALALVALAPVAAGVQWQQRHFAAVNAHNLVYTAVLPDVGARRARPARPAARGAVGRGPRLLPGRRRRACRGPRSSRPTPRPPAAPRTGCCSRTRRPPRARSGAGSPRPSARACPTCRRPR